MSAAIQLNFALAVRRLSDGDPAHATWAVLERLLALQGSSTAQGQVLSRVYEVHSPASLEQWLAAGRVHPLFARPGLPTVRGILKAGTSWVRLSCYEVGEELGAEFDGVLTDADLAEAVNTVTSLAELGSLLPGYLDVDEPMEPRGHHVGFLTIRAERFSSVPDDATVHNLAGASIVTPSARPLDASAARDFRARLRAGFDLASETPAMRDPDVPSFVLAERARGHLPKLTWQDYAELTSLLETFPDHRAWVLARYNLTNDDLLAVSDPFEQAFRADSNLTTSFRAHISARRDSLLLSQGPAPGAGASATRGTIDIDAALAARAATPFRPGPADLPPSSPVGTPARSYETVDLSSLATGAVAGGAAATKETAVLDESIVRAASLPFREPTPGSVPASAPPRAVPEARGGETREMDPTVVAAALARPATPFTPDRSPPPPSAQTSSDGLPPEHRREIEAIAGLEAAIDVNPGSKRALLMSLGLNAERFEARCARVAELRRLSAEADAAYRKKYERAVQEERR